MTFKTLQEILNNLDKVYTYINSVDEYGVDVAVNLASNRLSDTVKDFKTTASLIKDYLEYVQTYTGIYPNDHTPRTIEWFYENEWDNWGA